MTRKGCTNDVNLLTGKGWSWIPPSCGESEKCVMPRPAAMNCNWLHDQMNALAAVDAQFSAQSQEYPLKSAVDSSPWMKVDKGREGGRTRKQAN
jgi:hypothetical protein